MALPYVPTEWKSGDLVSSARLNKLEGGVKENSDAIVENTRDINNLKSEIDEVAEEPTVTTMTLEAGKTYDFGETAELTLTVGDGHYHFAFTSPAGTPTVLTVTGHTAECDDNDTIEAGKRYECDIWAGVLLLKNMDATEVVSGT